MKFGLALPHYEFSLHNGSPLQWASLSEVATLAEELGYDSIWVSDHLLFDLARYGGDSTQYNCLEWSTTLGALARATTRTRLGTLVLCLPIHHPLRVARSAASLDQLSRGRFELGVGAGWYRPDFELTGTPYGNASERMARMKSLIDEVTRLIDRMDSLTRPRIIIGGKGGPKLLSVVAEKADVWNLAWAIRPVDYGRKLETLRKICESASRDPSTVGLTLGLTTLATRNESDLAEKFEKFSNLVAGARFELSDFRAERLVGPVSEVIDRIYQFSKMGVEEIICSFGPVPFSISDLDDLHFFAENVITEFR